MAEHRITIELTGLLGIERSSSLIAHCVNACNPSQLNIPNELKYDIPPHLPRILIQGADAYDDIDVPSQSGAFSCLGGRAWTAVSLAGWELSFVGIRDQELNLSGLNILRLPTILERIGSYPNPLNLAWPRIASKIVIPRGKVQNGATRKKWIFEDSGNSFWELHECVRVVATAISPLTLHMRWLPDPNITAEVRLPHHDGNLRIRIENNIVATADAQGCEGGKDFVAHYHLVNNPLAHHPFPIFEVQPNGGSSINVQCSPLEYGP